MDNYLNPCFFHNCEKYTHPKSLLNDLDKIYQENYGKALPYIKLVSSLGILESTISHWQQCRPNNLLVLEKARLACEVSIFNSISGDPKLMFEAWKITRREFLET